MPAPSSRTVLPAITAACSSKNAISSVAAFHRPAPVPRGPSTFPGSAITSKVPCSTLMVYCSNPSALPGEADDICEGRWEDSPPSYSISGFVPNLTLPGTPRARRSDSMSATPDPHGPLPGQMRQPSLGKRKFKAPGLTTAASKPEQRVAVGVLPSPAASKLQQPVPASLAAAAGPAACQYFTCLYTKRAPQKVQLHCLCQPCTRKRQS